MTTKLFGHKADLCQPETHDAEKQMIFAVVTGLEDQRDWGHSVEVSEDTF